MRKTKKIIRRFFTIVIVFLFVFAAGFVGFGYLVNKYSPEVDVRIGDNTQYNPDEQVANIDERLKEIQSEDNDSYNDDDEVNSEEPDSVKSDSKKNDGNDEQALKDNSKSQQKEQKETSEKPPEVKKAPIPKKSEIANQIASGVKTKVFVGYYTSLEQAVVTQNELNDALPNVSPFIKESSGYYIVQIGVYSNADKAAEMYNKVKDLNYPVKMKTE